MIAAKNLYWRKSGRFRLRPFALGSGEPIVRGLTDRIGAGRIEDRPL